VNTDLDNPAVSSPSTLRSVPSKTRVREHWENEACGTRGLPVANRLAFFRQLERERYAQEPYIPGFAKFSESEGKRVLEIGVGAGTDFMQWTRHRARATGIDLTTTGLALTRERASLEGKNVRLSQGDAETLPFMNSSFDLVYSWGVLHHSPDTVAAIDEVYRVLRPGGIVRIMVYHVPSVVGWMLWTVHALGKGKPWRTPRWAIYHHLESPGTKAYTRAEARRLFAGFADVSIRTTLNPGDLLLMRPSSRYRSPAAALAWKLYPRWLVRLLGDGFGLNLMIEARK
jgi:SAM-dependent methyltransferase